MFCVPSNSRKENSAFSNVNVTIYEQTEQFPVTNLIITQELTERWAKVWILYFDQPRLLYPPSSPHSTPTVHEPETD